MNKRTLPRRRFLHFAAGALAAAAGLLRAAGAQAKAVPAHGIAELAEFKGEIITRANPLYLEWFWGLTWYTHKPRRFPRLIVQPEDVDDLRLAVAYAAKAGLRIAPRASGHNITHSPLREGVLTIDTLKLDHVEIDATAKTAWAGPGVLSERLNEALAEHRLAFPSAHTGFVTLGGYLLGGGMGWNMQQWGMAANSVLAVEVLLADGTTVLASEEEHPDLYWALRGVGPASFALILRYKLRLHDAPKAVQNIYYVPVERIESILAEVQRLAPVHRYSSELLGSFGYFNPPGTPDAEKKWHMVLMLYAFGPTAKEALAAAKVFNDSPVLRKEFQFARNRVLDYQQLYAQLGATDAYSIYRSTEIAFFTDNPGRCVRTTLETLAKQKINPLSFGFVELDCNPVVQGPASFTYGAPHYISWYLISNSPEQVADNEKLAVELHDALKPDIKTYYLNEVDFNLFPESIEASFTPAKWRRLREVRKRYDPHNLFVSWVGTDAVDARSPAPARASARARH